MTNKLVPVQSITREDSKFETVNSAKGIAEALIDTTKRIMLKDGRHAHMLFLVAEKKQK
jgi:hypothetical protein